MPSPKFLNLNNIQQIVKTEVIGKPHYRKSVGAKRSRVDEKNMHNTNDVNNRQDTLVRVVYLLSAVGEELYQL